VTTRDPGTRTVENFTACWLHVVKQQPRAGAGGEAAVSIKGKAGARRVYRDLVGLGHRRGGLAPAKERLQNRVGPVPPGCNLALTTSALVTSVADQHALRLLDVLSPGSSD
jgi:hypothetical protein